MDVLEDQVEPRRRSRTETILSHKQSESRQNKTNHNFPSEMKTVVSLPADHCEVTPRLVATKGGTKTTVVTAGGSAPRGPGPVIESWFALYVANRESSRLHTSAERNKLAPE